MRILPVAALSATLLLTGCASMFNESRQNVTIKTVPEGADILVDGRTLVAPTTVSLKGKSEYFVTASKKGYRHTSSKIEGDVRWGSSIVGNVLSWGLVGMAVDFLATGAGWKMQPEVTITLPQEEAAK